MIDRTILFMNDVFDTVFQIQIRRDEMLLATTDFKDNPGQSVRFLVVTLQTRGASTASESAPESRCSANS